jgi:hypothetical protein
MKYILMTVLAGFSMSCATTAPVVSSQDFSRLFEHRSGLIVPVETSSSEVKDCRMEFSDTKGRKQNVRFETGKDVYFAELPAGSYQVSKLACDRSVYTIENQPPWSRFVINEGSLSYFPLLKFNSPEKDVLIQFPDREQSVEAFKNTWKALSTEDRNRLILAQDGRKLTEKMQDIQKVVSFQFLNTQASGYEQIKEPVLDCSQKEILQHITVLGKTEYILEYKNRKLEKMEGGSRTSSTYSPQFFECLEKAFTDFRPETSKDVKISVKL